MPVPTQRRTFSWDAAWREELSDRPPAYFTPGPSWKPPGFCVKKHLAVVVYGNNVHNNDRPDRQQERPASGRTLPQTKAHIRESMRWGHLQDRCRPFCRCFATSSRPGRRSARHRRAPSWKSCRWSVETRRRLARTRVSSCR